MASLIYNSFWDDVVRGLLDVDSSSFKVLLTGNTYNADKDTHLTRTNVTGELTAGNGYTAGGNTVTVTVAKDNATDRITITLPGSTWTTAAGETLTARYAVYYQVVGTAETDRLVAAVDFTTDQTASNGGTLTLSNSTITLQN